VYASVALIFTVSEDAGAVAVILSSMGVSVACKNEDVIKNEDVTKTVENCFTKQLETLTFKTSGVDVDAGKQVDGQSSLNLHFVSIAPPLSLHLSLMLPLIAQQDAQRRHSLVVLLR